MGVAEGLFGAQGMPRPPSSLCRPSGLSLAQPAGHQGPVPAIAAGQRWRSSSIAGAQVLPPLPAMLSALSDRSTRGPNHD